MISNNLIIAPHADDETLGCGGTILKLKKSRQKVHCIILTNYDKDKEKIKFIKRRKELNKVKNFYKFNSLHVGPFKYAQLDNEKQLNIIEYLDNYIKKIKPSRIFVPHFADAHNDHKATYKCCKPFFKSFRYPYIKEVYIYETLSETNFNYQNKDSFFPNTWVEINSFIKKKIEAMKIYKSEINKHPFPRSEKSIESLSILRGSEANFKYAEAFMIIKKNISKF